MTNKNIMLFFGFLFLVSLCYALPVNNRLLAYYNFNASIADLSGNNASTTVVGNAAIQSTAGYSSTGGLVLDGSGDHVKVYLPLNANTGGSNTVNFWMKWGGGNWEMPVGFSNYDLWIADGGFGFNSNQGDVFGISSSGLANTWVYVSAVFYNGAPSSSTHKLYINGVLQNLSYYRGSSSVSWPTTDYFYMGTYGYSTTAHDFQGSLDEFAVYNRELNSTEVSQLYNSYIPEPSSILMLCIAIAIGFFRIRK